MSTTFNIAPAIEDEHPIALRFCGPHGLTVRFAFPQPIMRHMTHILVIGENGEQMTVGELFEKAEVVDFIGTWDHLGFGSAEVKKRVRAAS